MKLLPCYSHSNKQLVDTLRLHYRTGYVVQYQLIRKKKPYWYGSQLQGSRAAVMPLAHACKYKIHGLSPSK